MSETVELNQLPEKLTPEQLYTACRPEVIEAIVKAGKEFFASPYLHDIKETNIYNWLFLRSQETGVQVSAHELSKIIPEIYASVTNVLYEPHHRLTVGELQKQLEGLPKNTPIFYQRIEDEYFEKMNWTTRQFVWESSIATEEEIKWVNENPSEDNSYNLYEKDGNIYLRNMSNYIGAFSAYKRIDDDGKLSFVINAHY